MNQQIISRTFLKDFKRNPKTSYNFDDIKNLDKKVDLIKGYAYGLPHIVKAAQLGVDNIVENNKQNFFKTLELMKIDIELFLKSAYIESHAKINNIEYTINIESPNEDIFIEGIDTEELEAIIFEFCNNAGKHNMLHSNETCNISFSFKDNIIIVENNKLGESDNSGTQVGLDMIKIFLENKGYSMNSINKNNKFIIQIDIRKNDNEIR